MNAPLSTIEQDSGYLGRLGERVRAWRIERAMTLRTLADVSGISARYIAQLEAGQGDYSILMLRKLARAMGMDLGALVADGQRPPRSERVALVGLRGAGKSTLGKRLARLLRVPFLELDKEIERQAGASIEEVFAIYGQEAHRRFERRGLERILAAYPRFVIETGGSLVMHAQSYDLLLEHCVCVWLRTSAEEHMSRVIAQGDMRPFRGHSTALEEIRGLLRDREPLYARADAEVNTSRTSVSQGLRQLKRLLA